MFKKNIIIQMIKYNHNYHTLRHIIVVAMQHKENNLKICSTNGLNSFDNFLFIQKLDNYNS
jgi:hypothetical protein